MSNAHFKIANCRLDTKLTYISETIDKEEEILAFGEALRIEYEKNKLCKELTNNKLFELKTIRDLNKSIDNVIKTEL